MLMNKAQEAKMTSIFSSMNRNMRVVEISSFGGPEVLRLGERPVPQPGVGEVLIRVHASGINRPDVLQRLGH